MADTHMCFTLPNLEPIGSEFISVASGADDEAKSLPCTIPQPSLTDLNHLHLIHDKSPSTRNQKPGHIPRPRNAFILFRCDFVQQRVPEDVTNNHRDLSRLAGCMWRKMSEVQKRPWFEKAEVEKRYHSQVFPGYRFSPMTTDRPKRIYRRKKPPVSDEILLTHPHRRRSESEPRMSRTAPSSTKHSSSASFPAAIPQPLPPPALVYDDDRSRVLQHQGFPQSYTRHQSVTSTLSSELPPNPDHHSFTSPGAYCGGFVNIPRRHSSAEFDWEFSPPDSIIYEQRGQWPTSEGGSTNLHEINSVYDCTPACASSSLEEQYILNSMWKDLGTFHDQALYQRSPDQDVGAVAPHAHASGFSGDQCDPSQHRAYYTPSLSTTGDAHDP